MCIHQVWMVHLLHIESIAFLFYSQLLLLNGVSYFHGRIGLYALGYLDGPIAPGSIIFWDTSHSNYYIKLIEASSTCRPILVIFGSKAVTLLLKESFIRTRKMYLQHYYVILCYNSHATSIWRVTKMNPHIIPWRPKHVSIWTIKRLIVALFCLAKRIGIEKGSPRSSP